MRSLMTTLSLYIQRIQHLSIDVGSNRKNARGRSTNTLDSPSRNPVVQQRLPQQQQNKNRQEEQVAEKSHSEQQDEESQEEREKKKQALQEIGMLEDMEEEVDDLEDEPEEIPDEDLITASKRLKAFRESLGGRDLEPAEFKAAMLAASEKNVLPAQAMKKVLKELLGDIFPGCHVTASAFKMICVAAEDAVTNTFFVSNVLSMTRERQTVNAGDVKLASIITGVVNNGRGLDLHTNELEGILQAYGHEVNVISDIYKPGTDASNGHHYSIQEDMAIVARDRWTTKKRESEKEHNVSAARPRAKK